MQILTLNMDYELECFLFNSRKVILPGAPPPPPKQIGYKIESYRVAIKTGRSVNYISLIDPRL